MYRNGNSKRIMASNGNAGVSVSVYVCQNLNDDIETENAVLDFIRFEPIC